MVRCAITTISGTGTVARRFDCCTNLVQVAKRFEHQAVDAGFHQSVNLLAEDGSGFVDGGRAERLQANSQGSDGSRDEGLIASGLAGDSHTSSINQPDFIRESKGCQALAVRSKRVGLDDFRAGAYVLLMDVAYQGGEREIQFVKAPIDEGALGVEPSAHGAVGHPYALGKGLPELGGPGRCRGHWHVGSLFKISRAPVRERIG